MKKFFNNAKAYLYDSKYYIYFTVVLFLTSGLIGYVASDYLSEIFDPIIKELFSITEGLNGKQITLFILSNNLRSSFFALFAGIFFGLPSIANAILNGSLIGYVISIVSKEVGLASIWRLVPHGIFELPAIFISIGLGTRLGFSFISNYLTFYKKDRKMKSRALVVVILSIIAIILFSSSLNHVSESASELSVIAFLANLAIIIFALFAISVFLFSSKKLRKIQLNDFKKNLKGSSRVFLAIVIPLLVIAAIIEGLLITFS